VRGVGAGCQVQGAGCGRRVRGVGAGCGVWAQGAGCGRRVPGAGCGVWAQGAGCRVVRYPAMVIGVYTYTPVYSSTGV